MADETFKLYSRQHSSGSRPYDLLFDYVDTNGLLVKYNFYIGNSSPDAVQDSYRKMVRYLENEGWKCISLERNGAQLIRTPWIGARRMDEWRIKDIVKADPNVWSAARGTLEEIDLFHQIPKCVLRDLPDASYFEDEEGNPFQMMRVRGTTIEAKLQCDHGPHGYMQSSQGWGPVDPTKEVTHLSKSEMLKRHRHHQGFLGSRVNY